MSKIYELSHSVLKQEVLGDGFMNMENRVPCKHLRERLSADSSYVALWMVNSPTVLETFF